MSVAPLAVLVPVLAATLLAATSPFVTRRRLAGIVAVLAVLASAGLCAAALVEAHGDTLVVWFGGWEPRAGVAVGIDFAVDPIGAGMALFVAVLGVAALVMCIEVIQVEDNLFDAIALVFIAAMVGFCLTGDLFNLFVFFELMSVCAYVLVGYEIRKRAPLEGALTFAITNSIGSILLLFGIALLYGRTGALNLAQMGRALAEGPADGLVVVSYALVAGGLLVKAAVVPFHFWTADAYAVAPTPVGLLLGGAFSELGLFGLARVYWTVFDEVLAPHEAELRAILVGLGVLTALVGAVMCAAQHHLKRMLAFATISHVGLFLVGIGLLDADGLAGAAVWIVGDGLVKAALFASVGLLNDRFATVEEAELHGRGREIGGIGVLFCVGALAVASLPPFGPFLGKTLVEDAALTAGYAWVPAVMVVVSALTGGALLRVGGARVPRARRPGAGGPALGAGRGRPRRRGRGRGVARDGARAAVGAGRGARRGGAGVGARARGRGGGGTRRRAVRRRAGLRRARARRPAAAGGVLDAPRAGAHGLAVRRRVGRRRGARRARRAGGRPRPRAAGRAAGARDAAGPAQRAPGRLRRVHGRGRRGPRRAARARGRLSSHDVLRVPAGRLSGRPDDPPRPATPSRISDAATHRPGEHPARARPRAAPPRAAARPAQRYAARSSATRRTPATRCRRR